MEPEEKKLFTLMQRVNTLRADKQRLEKRRARDSREKMLKRREAEAAPFKDRHREEKKRKFREEGLKAMDRAGKRAKSGFVASSS
jgi:ribosome biogenesis protein BMS1